MTLDARVAAAVGGCELRLTLRAAAGEVVAVLGPNGAGKTTLLRVLAGLLPLDAGSIALDGAVLDAPSARRFVPPERRSVGVVFQNGCLFPHLSVRDNVAFGLRCRGAAPRAAARCANAWLARFGLEARAAARPPQLSGGEAQRVALARALAFAPRLLLLDEPLAALDVATRATVRRDLRRHLDGFAGVAIVVTHDPLEAMALASRLVVLEHGVIVQEGAAAELTAQPRSRYVADLAGVNLYRGDARESRVALDGGGSLAVADAGTGAVFAVIHPRAVALHREPPGGTPRNVWQGSVEALDAEGSRVRVRVSGAPAIVAEVTPAAVAALGLDRGGTVWVSVKATEITTYPA